MKSIIDTIYDELKDKPEYEPAFDILDREQVLNIIVDGSTYWLEMARYNDAEWDQIVMLEKYIEQKGYKRLGATKV